MAYISRLLFLTWTFAPNDGTLHFGTGKSAELDAEDISSDNNPSFEVASPDAGGVSAVDDPWIKSDVFCLGTLSLDYMLLIDVLDKINDSSVAVLPMMAVVWL